MLQCSFGIRTMATLTCWQKHHLYIHSLLVFSFSLFIVFFFFTTGRKRQFWTKPLCLVVSSQLCMWRPQQSHGSFQSATWRMVFDGFMSNNEMAHVPASPTSIFIIYICQKTKFNLGKLLKLKRHPSWRILNWIWALGIKYYVFLQRCHCQAL